MMEWQKECTLGAASQKVMDSWPGLPHIPNTARQHGLLTSFLYCLDAFLPKIMAKICGVWYTGELPLPTAASSCS